MPQRTTLYVIYMPYTLKEYNVGQLLTTCRVSEREANNGMRVTVLENKAVESEETAGPCQYTSKVIDFSKKVQSFLRKIAPSGSLTMSEKSHNAFPVCKTVYTSGALSEKKFKARIDTLFLEGHKAPIDPFSDGIISENCEVLDLVYGQQMCEGIDLATVKGDDGNLLFKEGWEKEHTPVMTIFKRVHIDLHIPFIGWKYIEDVDKFMRKMFIQGHQEVIKYHSEWKDMDMDGVREEEAKTKAALEAKYPPKGK
ncbi:hypothetical protein NEAUS04_1311 [Nematocida ausubeli]|uniref:Phosphatidylinositol transfer protein N-terminal domain-containing protein n=1 Tax=Nematocida ausubeli (strain ATCC PRA-371 / ERTm2) TaxID=1913371 RepID=H8ZDV1_NEMA1|nr:uncharacterized protein NESG_00125 [Nematocida ausubeli]EHY65326.1 hypothetical protein NERG_01772 [Nematocida ausubeli]KAI5132473.1 hypothetical protein NEAUS06_0168 [Nematocida ausubeli]KAI5132758.1 hypothetical protein NEAUS07_0266 [Nematocida ausubeli]KAI5148817.1 hypothetical protein NEAUS05_1542 [Nematocida ausubeli]KAI5163030.1 hypothetical protein NEAUS04_1311 [Nematocida ausubeli]